MKTSLLSLIFLLAGANPAFAKLSRFECLRELLPISDRGSLQVLRNGYESPILQHERFLIFPQVRSSQVTGFFIFSNEKAWFFDGVTIDNKKVAIRDLKVDRRRGVLDLVAQPNGLETVSIGFLPGFNPATTNGNASAVLGSSVMPVVGAFVSRPQARRVVYHDPLLSSKADIREWVSDHAGGRGPAGVDTSEVAHTIVKLVNLSGTPETSNWDPLTRELRIRRRWVQDHNLDEEMFRKLNRVIDGDCAGY